MGSKGQDDKQKLRQRIGQLRTNIKYDIEYLIHYLQDFDASNIARDESQHLNGLAQRLVDDTTAYYWLMFELEEV